MHFSFLCTCLKVIFCSSAGSAAAAGTGLPRVQPPDQLQKTVSKAVQELHDFRHPGALTGVGISSAAGSNTTQSRVAVSSLAGFSGAGPSAAKVARTTEVGAWPPVVQTPGSGVPPPTISTPVGGGQSWAGQHQHNHDATLGLRDNQNGSFDLHGSRPLYQRFSDATGEWHSDEREDRFGRERYSAMDEEGAGRREFLEATRPIVFPEAMDDRNRTLHPVRTRPGIIDYREGERMSPIIQQSCYSLPDFTYLGIRIGSSKVVRMIHDRSCPLLKLNMFSPSNISTMDHVREKITKLNKKTGHFSEVDNYFDLISLGDSLQALDNYEILYSWCHPMCYAAKALKRVVLDKAAEFLVEEHHIETFFGIIITENSGRITRREPPLTHPELCLRWDQTVGGIHQELRRLQKDVNDMNANGNKRSSNRAGLDQGGFGAQSTSNYDHQGNRSNSSSYDHTAPRHGNPGRSSGGAFGSGSSPGNSGKKTAGLKTKGKKGGQSTRMCPDFNSSGGCHNEQSPIGCTRDGRRYRHGCSIIVDGEFCDRMDHNRHTHV